MALIPEWRKRINHWHRELKNHFYFPLGTVELEGFLTMEHLPWQKALEGAFQPMPEGTCWGAKWEYGWFRTSLELPKEALGKRIVLVPGLHIESLVYINGKAAGASDKQHSEITLCQAGKPGDRYQMLAETYAGHGPRPCGGGPVPAGKETVPEPESTQVEIEASTFGIWEEEAFQAWMDLDTLLGLRDELEPESLRVSEIDAALRSFSVAVDLELPRAEMLRTLSKGREILKPLLQCVNGSTSPELFAVGHAHIDVAWLWPLAETERKVARTLSTQLALMEEYPEFRFLQSQPHLYQMLKTRYPEQYELVKKAVARGSLIPEGGMWVEADTNVPGGEALIRQFVHGKRFFREEFGIDNEILWLPDVFGYSGALPQILRGCGIKYFSTAKIFWTYHGGDPFPYNTFHWEGIDGSDVLVHLCNNYNSQVTPKEVTNRWKGRVQKDGISTRLFPFGYGDGGGGPKRDHLEYLRRMGNLEGLPRVRQASPVEFFHDLEKRGVPPVRYLGELYFQCHRGTYTSQAKTKLLMRRSESALRDAEMWSCAAHMSRSLAVPAAALDAAWKEVLLNQFHDIIPGSSIGRVYQEAEASLRQVVDAAEDISRKALARVGGVGSGEGLLVANSLSWERTSLVKLPSGWKGAASHAGESLPLQIRAGDVYAEVTAPPCGWTTLSPASPSVSKPDGKAPTLRVETKLLENEFLRLEVNAQGEITSIQDKESGREWAAGACNAMRMYKDVPSAFDAWDIDLTYKENPVELPGQASIRVLEKGPLSASLQVERRLHDSDMVQTISLRRGSRRVDFHTVIEWRESHKLLKVEFPVNVRTSEVVNEIQFGHVRRPNHASRPFDADRFEISNHKWSALAEENGGVAVLNDCKYGLNASGQTLALTLLKSALAPDMRADKGRQEFTYSVYPWNGSLAESGVVQEAYELNVPLLAVEGAAGEAALFSTDNPHIIVETVKPAEDGSGDVVVRLYESMRTTGNCRLHTSLPFTRAVETDMLEAHVGDLDLKDGNVSLQFRPFQVRTIRLSGKSS